MPQIYQADVLKAKAEVAQAEIELQTSALWLIIMWFPLMKENGKSQIGCSKAELNLAQTHLSFTTIKAPFSGIIDRLPLKLGSLIDESDLLTTLSDNGGIYAYFNVSEPEYLYYQMHSADRGNNLVSLIMANGEPFPDKGIIQTIEGEFDNETGNIAFRAKIRILNKY
jgi:membrane fusion protein (multidrug efflux system)